MNLLTRTPLDIFRLGNCPHRYLISLPSADKLLRASELLYLPSHTLDSTGSACWESLIFCRFNASEFSQLEAGSTSTAFFLDLVVTGWTLSFLFLHPGLIFSPSSSPPHCMHRPLDRAMDKVKIICVQDFPTILPLGLQGFWKILTISGMHGLFLEQIFFPLNNVCIFTKWTTARSSFLRTQ